jgi:hypothetical protein
MFEYRVLINVVGPKMQRVVKLRKMGSVGHVARMEEKKNTHGGF